MILGGVNLGHPRFILLHTTHKKPQIVTSSIIKDMIKILMKILKALMKKFKVCAHPKVCRLLTIAILINHV